MPHWKLFIHILKKASLLAVPFCCTISFAQNAPKKIKGDVTVYKYWHVVPSKPTTNIALSKKLPQFQNQVKVYQQVDRLIARGKHDLIISEGCEGEIDQNFTGVFNGWTYKDLNHRVGTERYKDILTLVPLKLEVKYKEKLTTICGDKLSLIKQSQQAFQELEGLVAGYSMAPKPEKRKRLRKAERLISKIKFLVQKRNQSFVETAVKYLDQHPLIVVGGTHLEGLAELLYSRGDVAFKVIEAPGYPQQDEKHLERLLRSMENAL